jgi:hypothetical protein
MKHISRRLMVLGACTATVGALAVPAAAAETFVIEFPAGVACTFPLSITVVGSSQVVEELPAGDGFTRVLNAGTGTENTYTNMDTSASFTSKANGSVISTTTTLADGSSTSSLTGHTIVIQFPTDVPAGPSTTLYTGRVALRTTAGVTTVVKEAGRALDVCAALTPAG